MKKLVLKEKTHTNKKINTIIIKPKHNNVKNNNKHKQTDTYRDIHTKKLIDTHKQTHTHIDTYTDTQKHTHIHSYTQTYTQT